GAEVLVVPLGLDQGDLVCPACHGGPAELDPVVLPEADGADLVRAGHRAQYAMPAARAGAGVAHLRSLVAGPPVCHGFLRLRPPTQVRSQSAGHPCTTVGSQRVPTGKPQVRALDGAPPQVRISPQTFRFNV